ncbi:MAG: indole-3-glycerol phosphate synthase TrpC [Patescibacteria group bacterium]|jgi:indole-3-glycerol phosphate synthase
MNMLYRKTGTILDKICDNKILEVKERMKKTGLEDLKKIISAENFIKRDFSGALKKSGLTLIAEIKNSSPSLSGRLFRDDFNPAEIAKIYEKRGASAISVITDEKFFKGKLEFIPAVRSVSSLPILRKDFILSAYQLYEAKAYGADAVLLMASILNKTRLMELHSLANQLNLDVLLEVHDEDELKTALECSPKIIGVNNRDLKTMKIDLDNFVHLSPLIPGGIIKVAESGISSKKAVQKIRTAGADAILVGTSLMKAKDIGQAIDELMAGDKY